MNATNENNITCYFFDEFLPYRAMFEAHCPPPMKVSRGTALCRQGITKDWMYYLCDGCMRVYTCNSEGKERIVAFLKHDTLFGLDCFEKNSLSLISIEAITDCTVMPFQRSMLEQFIRENADFAVDLTHYYCKVLRQLCFDAKNQSINSILVRTANFLLSNWDDHSNRRIPLSQQAIADAVGCSRSSIARALKQLREMGAISSQGVGLMMLDHTLLEKVASLS